MAEGGRDAVVDEEIQKISGIKLRRCEKCNDFKRIIPDDHKCNLPREVFPKPFYRRQGDIYCIENVGKIKVNRALLQLRKIFENTRINLKRLEDAFQKIAKKLELDVEEVFINLESDLPKNSRTLSTQTDFDFDRAEKE